MNESHSHDDISDQITALRRQVFVLLLVLIIISGTLMVFLGFQSRYTQRDIALIKPQAVQIIQNYQLAFPAITNFVQHLVVYGQAHPDFQQQVLRKYNITPQTLAASKK
jgi:hypothetical protein